MPAKAALLALQGACDASPVPGYAGGPVDVFVQNERPASQNEPGAACHRAAGAGLLGEEARASLRLLQSRSRVPRQHGSPEK